MLHLNRRRTIDKNRLTIRRLSKMVKGHKGSKVTRKPRPTRKGSRVTQKRPPTTHRTALLSQTVKRHLSKRPTIVSKMTLRKTHPQNKMIVTLIIMTPCEHRPLMMLGRSPLPRITKLHLHQMNIR